MEGDSTFINYRDVVSRITRFQAHFTQLRDALTDYKEKMDRESDKTIEISKCLMKYKQLEPYETTSQYAIQLAADIMGRMAEHEKCAAIRLEKKVLPTLSTYKSICKCLKKDVERTVTARARFIAKKKLRRAFDRKSDTDPKFLHAMSDADKDLLNSKAEWTQLNMFSQEQILKFEHKRLMDMKDVLSRFLKTELAKHAKFLELLTEAYRYITSIDEDEDLNVLKRRLLPISANGSGDIDKHRHHKHHRIIQTPKKSESEEESDEEWSTDEEESETDSEAISESIHEKRGYHHKKGAYRDSKKSSKSYRSHERYSDKYGRFKNSRNSDEDDAILHCKSVQRKGKGTSKEDKEKDDKIRSSRTESAPNQPHSTHGDRPSANLIRTVHSSKGNIVDKHQIPKSNSATSRRVTFKEDEKGSEVYELAECVNYNDWPFEDIHRHQRQEYLAHTNKCLDSPESGFQKKEVTNKAYL